MRGCLKTVALAWVEADESDDAQRLLACLVAALEPFDVPWRMAPEALIAAAQGPLKASKSTQPLEMGSITDTHTRQAKFSP